MFVKVGIGQDSHRFLTSLSSKPCLVGGVIFEETPGLDADSDGDVVLHSLCNAITSITHVPLLGDLCIKMCKKGITDSKAYVKKGMETLHDYKIVHVAFSIEGSRPKFQTRSEEIRQSVADLLDLNISQIGITFTSGDGLSDFGKGLGLMCFCILTVESN